MTTQTKSFRELIGIPSSTASIHDSVLVIIDAQNEYETGLLRTQNLSNTLSTITTLLQKYRSANAPLVHILHQVPDGAPVFTPRTTLAQEFEQLSPLSSEKIIHKNHPGSFTSTDLDAYIKETGKTKVVLTGYMAHVCVSTTARQAAEKGYEVLLVEDAIGDRDIPGAKAEDLVKTVLAELGDAFGTVMKARDIGS